MTFLVKINDVVAIDSLITDDGIILDDSFNKFIERGDTVYLFTGHMCNFERMADMYENWIKTKIENLDPEMFIDTTMFVFNRKTGKLTQFTASKESKSVRVSPITTKKYCYGSGRKYGYGALAIMEETLVCLGNDDELAEDVINAVSKCCNTVGGKVNIFRADID